MQHDNVQYVLKIIHCHTCFELKKSFLCSLFIKLIRIILYYWITFIVIISILFVLYIFQNSLRNPKTIS